MHWHIGWVSNGHHILYTVYYVAPEALLVLVLKKCTILGTRKPLGTRINSSLGTHIVVVHNVVQRSDSGCVVVLQKPPPPSVFLSEIKKKKNSFLTSGWIRNIFLCRPFRDEEGKMEHNVRMTAVLLSLYLSNHGLTEQLSNCKGEIEIWLSFSHFNSHLFTHF